ncbi:Lsr2 family DNA-binding protein [Streptomyces purpurogeneiscleroticus]|uniref:Lsr2 family DNA-binding protein n=1 Tax=Streptomyces purpurogeneiscleroticus TaxID=68259 RepID=UPI001CBA917B|nr:histone-like nucleoid-structuring protein Lsr2 [Streptomyces purpurogeneiscleroticus]MBZ4019674.1 hypothetical protein [Streptomyces purpurogeneiscleroticus]
MSRTGTPHCRTEPQLSTIEDGTDATEREQALAHLELELIPTRPTPYEPWRQPLTPDRQAQNRAILEAASEQQFIAAARVTARHVHDKDDLAGLLAAVGLPHHEDALTALFPLLSDPTGGRDMPQSPNAFEATALSMYYADHPVAQITEATGLTEDEITALVTAQERKIAADSDGTPLAESAAGDSVQQLLAWAETHQTASICNKAARVRGDLAELTTRLAAEGAQREAEERIATLKAELEQAQEQLRAVKAGPRTPVATSPPTALHKRSKCELAAIRTWARAHGHQVADRGLPAKSVLDAYDAARPDRP